MALLRIEKPPRILVGVFSRSSDLRAARAALEARGVGSDFIGAIVRASEDRGGSGHSRYANLLSVVVPRGGAGEIEAVLKDSGAVEVREPADLPLGLKDIPHPGMIEDLEMKFPAGREFPDSTWAPAISGYRVRPLSLDARDRIWTFDEVELDYSPQEALMEASRCLNCPDSPCRDGCPAHNDIPGFIRAIRDLEFARGIAILRKTTNFPDVCGRVCDKARQCEGSCTLGREGGDAVGIGALERFLADWELREGLRKNRIVSRSSPTGRKIAVVGSGPSGLAVAGDLALCGHEVTVFEELPVPGGALAWGIPAFRLPPAVVQAHIDFLEALGVQFRLGVKVGVNVSPADLFEQGYDAVYIGAGATMPTGLSIPGEELQGVYTATEFLSRAKLSRIHKLAEFLPPVVGERLVVIGGGNTAMDVAQTALRLGIATIEEGQQQEHTTMDVAETALRLGFREVMVVYRRSETEMPARREEVEGAKEEGTRFRFLTAPVRFIGDEQGRVKAMECIEMELGRPDSRGRRNPVPKPGTEFTMQADTVVLALGYNADATLAKAFEGVDSDRAGLFTVDAKTGRTNRTGIWAGGDVVSGADTVVRAMAAGKRAAGDIDKYLRSVSA